MVDIAEFAARKNLTPEDTTAIVPAEGTMASAFETWAKEKDAKRSQQAALLSEGFAGKGFDEVAGAKEMARMAREQGGPDLPPAFYLNSELQRTIELQQVRRSFEKAPEGLVRWSLEDPMNAVLAKGDMQNLSVMGELATSAASVVKSARELTVPNLAFKAAVKQMGAAEQNVEDREKTFFDILDEEVRQIADVEPQPSVAVGLLKTFTGVDLSEALPENNTWAFLEAMGTALAAPGDALGRYLRSRNAPEGGDDARIEDLRQTAMRRLNVLSQKTAELQDERGRNAAYVRIAPKFSEIAESGKAPGEQMADAFRLMADDPAGAMMYLASTTAESIPGLIVAALGARVGIPAAATLGATSFARAENQSFEQVAKDRGYDIGKPDDVLRMFRDPAALEGMVDDSVRYSAVVAFWDAVSGAAAGQALAKSPTGDILIQGMAQGAFGGLGEAAAQLASNQDVNGVDVLMEILAEFTTAPLEVAAVGGRKLGQASGAEQALRGMRDRRGQKRRTDNERAFFDALSKGSDGSELKKKSPAAFREAVSAMTANGPVETVYADAEAVNELLQSGKINPAEFEQVTGISPDEVARQASVGGDIQISTADFAAKVVGTPIADALRDHTRLSPDTLSMAEFKAMQDADTQGEAEALAAAVTAGEAAFAPEIEAARARMAEQFRAAGRAGAEAETVSLLFASQAQTTAAVLGVAPAAYLRRFPMPEVRTGATPAPAPAPLDQSGAPFREWFGDSIVRDETGAARQVYHGAVGDFDAFRPGRFAWVSSTPELANTYAESRRDGMLRGNIPYGPVTVMPLYARVTRPFDTATIPARLTVDDLIAALRAAGAPVDPAAAEAAEAAMRAFDTGRPQGIAMFWQNGEEGDRAFIDLLTAYGYDAIQHIERGSETFGVFDPAQLKSPFNRGSYRPTDPRLLYQANALRAGTETLESFGLDPAGRYTTREIAVALEKRTRKKTGSIDREDRSDKARDKIAKHIVDEVMFEVGQAAVDPSKSAVGWYTTKTQRAIDVVGETFPELLGEPSALALPGPAMLGGDQRAVRAFFTALLAVTSDGAKVADNFKRAVQIYGNWRETAVLTAEGAMGSNRGSVPGNLDKLDTLIRTIGPQALWTTLLEPKTISELKKAAKATGVDLGAASKYKATMTLPMSAVVFGPKLGAFYANLMGDTGYLTMDRWWSRSFNRYRGTLIPTLNETGVERVRGLLQAAGVQIADDATAEEVALATVPFRNSYEAKDFKNGTELEKAANTLWKQAFAELNDVPFNASDREFMVETVKRARALLKKRGVDLTVADIQAVLWYYEKRLYGTLGAKQTQDVSYEEAARRAAEGYSAGRPADQGAGEPESASSLDVGADGEFIVADDTEGLTLYQSAAPAFRLPDLEKASPGPVPGVRDVATAYMQAQGLPVRHQASYVKVDVERAREIARLYDEMEDAPDDPQVRAAYTALARETIQQYEALLELGFTFEWITGEDPYASPREAILDMQQNRHLWVFPTTEGFGTVNEAASDHPLLQPTEHEIDGRVALVNDLFRIVHDVFGHGSEGAAFGARGEENAWQAHVRMFSPLAARAMTAETRGQNSWVNFGPYGEQNRANPANTVFADQKAGLLPEWVSAVGQAEDRPMAEVMGWPRLAEFEALTPELLQRDGWYIITGMKEGNGDKDAPANIAANAALRAALDARGLEYMPVSGMYKGEPQGESYLVIGDTAEGLALGRAFGQESILTFRGLEYGDGRPDTPQLPAETVVGPAALESDFYSVMPDGTPWTMGLDWSEPVEGTELFQSAPPAESDAFKAWFGNSAVVDENGAPLVVYHGTTGAAIEAFDPERKGVTSVLFSTVETHRQGFYFAEKEGFARGFAEQGGRRGTGTVMPVYLSIQNPLDVTSDDNASVDRLRAVIARAQEIDPEINNPDFLLRPGDDSFWETLDTAEGGDVFVQAMRDLGYDGIKMIEPDLETADPNYVPDDTGAVTWVAFEPTQIKSVDNRGTFDPNDARVLYQSAPARLYYSPLLEGARTAKQAKAKGKDWLAILPKLPGVKEAELVFTGTLDWLETLRDDTVTREEIVAHIERNQIDVVELEGGVSQAMDAPRGTRGNKWLQYTEAGATNYREFLLTVPNLTALPVNEGTRPFVNDVHYSDPNIVVTARTTDRTISGKRALFAEEVQSDLSSDNRKAGQTWKNRDGKSGPSEEEIAAARTAYEQARRAFMDAYDAQTLGRYTGQQVSEFADFAARAGTATRLNQPMPQITPIIADMAGGLTGEARNAVPQVHETFLAWQQMVRANNRQNRVPFTPFEEGAAYELAVKRLLQRAAREGYEAFSWTPAWMQSRRWSKDYEAGYIAAYDRQIKSAVEKIAKRFGAKVTGGTLEIKIDRDTAIEDFVQDKLDEITVARRPVERVLDEIGVEGSLRRQFDNVIETAREEAAQARAVFERARLAEADKRIAELQTSYDALGDDEEGADLRPRFLRRIERAQAERAEQVADFDHMRDDYLENSLVDDLRYNDAFRALLERVGAAVVGDATTAEDVWTVEINDAMRAALAEPFPLFQEKRGSIVLPRGDGQTAVLSIYAGADASTAIHEGAHHFLHVMETLVQSGEAPQRMIDDWRALTDWWRSRAAEIAAEAGTDADHVIAYLDGTPMDQATGRAIWTALHEQTARGFEAYAAEGKAPTLGLRSAFEAFRAWLIAVYRTVTTDSALRVQITDDVRLVFDHWLATDEQIAQATVTGGLDREAALKAGVPEGELDALARLALEVQDEAKAYMLGLPGPRAARRLDWRRKRGEAIERARAELSRDPAHQAVQWLSKRQWIGPEAQPEDLPDAGLNRRILLDVYGEDVVRGLGAMAQEDGADFDDVAPFFGFESGDAMVQALRVTPDFARAVRARATAELRAAQGRPGADDADAALNGDKRGQQLDAEFRALRKAATGIPAFTRRQAAVIADQTIRAMPARAAIKTQDFLAAERRAGRKVEQALAKGDLAAAAKAKRDQLLQHSLYNASRRAAETVEKARRRARRLQSAGTRKNLAGDYLPAIDQVLETYDFRRLPRGAELDRTRLAAFIARMEAEGRAAELAIPQHVRDETKRRPYLTLTVAELEGVLNTLVNIEHTARLKNKLRTAQAERDLRETADAMIAEMDANLPDKPRGRIASRKDRFVSGLRNYANIGLNVETRLRQYGGWKLGASYDALKRDIDRAGVVEQTMAYERDLKVEALYGMFSRQERLNMGRKRSHPVLGGSYSQWDLIAMALNMGNAENLDRLKGRDTQHPMSDRQIEYVKATLTQRDWDFVEGVWELIDSYWPLIAARERRVTGVVPKKVEAEPFELPDGRVIRGGYYPIKYDGELSSAVSEEQLQEQLKMMQAGRFGKAQTRQGHLEARTGSGGRVLLLDVGVFHQHLADVIHDLAFAEVAGNTWRVLRDGGLRAAFQRKGLQPDLDMLEIWVQDVAMGAMVGGGAPGRWAMMLKGNFTTSRLALNTATAYLQLTGFTHSIAAVGARDMAAGLGQFLGNPRGAWMSVLAQSEFMRHKLRLFHPDVAEMRMQTNTDPISAGADTFMQQFIRYGLLPMQALQTLVDVPTWLGAHRKALRQGKSPAEAILLADRAVVRAQGGTAIADRTAFERGSFSRDVRYHGVLRLLATLASYMMTKGNLAREVVGRARTDGGVEAAATAAFHLFLLFTVEGMVRALTSGELDDDDDDDDVLPDPLRALLKETALSSAGTLPLVRDIAGYADGFGAGGGYGSIVETIGKPIKEISQGEMDKGLAKAVINAIGLATGLPSGQINRIVDAAANSGEDDAHFTDYLFGVKK